jgi:putrescine transport system permease protein
MVKRKPWFLYSLVLFGYAFLYVPIASLVIYSFNQSKMVTVWGGFSTQWYSTLWQNEAIMTAFRTSLIVAVLSATFAVIIGTLAAVGLTRLGKFRGRMLLSILTTTPLVMPEIMLGLSALLLFITMQQLFGWPSQRGIATITMAHITLCTCYATVVIQSRLGSMDDSLEEAAMDLGARPWKVFFLITLPIIAPAIIAAWLLAFTLSLDDLVVASFVSGPSSTTLPMEVYSRVRLGLSPEINALATLIIALVTSLLIFGVWIWRRSERKTPV